MEKRQQRDFNLYCTAKTITHPTLEHVLTAIELAEKALGFEPKRYPEVQIETHPIGNIDKLGTTAGLYAHSNKFLIATPTHEAILAHEGTHFAMNKRDIVVARHRSWSSYGYFLNKCARESMAELVASELYGYKHHPEIMANIMHYSSMIPNAVEQQLSNKLPTETKIFEQQLLLDMLTASACQNSAHVDKYNLLIEKILDEFSQKLNLLPWEEAYPAIVKAAACMGQYNAYRIHKKGIPAKIIKEFLVTSPGEDDLHPDEFYLPIALAANMGKAEFLKFFEDSGSE